MKIEKHRIVSNKMDYSRGKRPAVDCILCAVAGNDPKVDNLTVFRRDSCFITLNLYPYNPGHLMVVPVRHIEDIRDLTTEEAAEMHRMQVFSLEVLDKVYHPAGYNLGYNVGKASGASIPHLHLQIVPRYATEIGFFDIISDSRVIVEDPAVTLENLRTAYEEAAPEFFSGK